MGAGWLYYHKYPPRRKCGGVEKGITPNGWGGCLMERMFGKSFVLAKTR